MRGVCGTKVPLLGGSRVDQEVEGGGCPRGTSWSHARRSGVQGVLGQEAEVLPAGVVEGAGGVEARIEEKARGGGAGRGRQGGREAGVGERGESGWREREGRLLQSMTEQSQPNVRRSVKRLNYDLPMTEQSR